MLHGVVSVCVIKKVGAMLAVVLVLSSVPFRALRRAKFLRVRSVFEPGTLSMLTLSGLSMALLTGLSAVAESDSEFVTGMAWDIMSGRRGKNRYGW